MYNYAYLQEVGLAWTLITLNLVLFFSTLIVFEIMHRRTLAQEDSFNKVQRNMTISEFETAIAKGSKYVILDELVLNLEGFAQYHPGGKFVIEHNIG